MEAVQVTQEQLDRKARTEDRLRAEGVPINEWLPCVEGEADVAPRSKHEVVDRAIALMAVALRGEEAPADVVAPFVREFRVESKLSPWERRFMATSTPGRQDLVDASWRYEGLYVLLWSLSFFDGLQRPERQFDPSQLGAIVLGSGTEAQFSSRASLRSCSELLDLADLLYRYHWAVRDAQLWRQPAPAGLDAGVVRERDHASRWLISYLDHGWDDVSCDT